MFMFQNNVLPAGLQAPYMPQSRRISGYYNSNTNMQHSSDMTPIGYNNNMYSGSIFNG